MDKYITYCTKEQTKKVFELGAPLIIDNPRLINPATHVQIDKWYYSIPTAEQMLNWLRIEKGFLFKISEFDNIVYWQYRIADWFKNGDAINYKEAVLTLIDNSLEYLIKYNKNRRIDA